VTAGRSTSDITPEMLPQFLELRASSVPVREIARLLGVGCGSVGRTVRRLGLQHQRGGVAPFVAPALVAVTASERLAAGVAPLEAGHRLTWGAIAGDVRWPADARRG
jgi:hypothetical protein